MTRFACLLACLSALALASGCRTTAAEDQSRLEAELGLKLPLWVEVECTKNGKPKFKEYSVLKMPNEKVLWSMAKLDPYCRIYGAIIPKTAKSADLCDIRFRSKDPVNPEGKCRCVPGKYVLEEGRPTSSRCCEKYPDKVYCRQPEPEPVPPPDAAPPTVAPDAVPPGDGAN
jgi:hypothetical protein